MKLAAIVAAFATLAAASPKSGYGQPRCLTDADAKELVFATTKIFTSNDPTKLVLKYFTADYKQYTDSTSLVIGPPIAPPLGEPFSSSRKEFLKQHVGFNPDNPGYTVEDYFHNCNKIVFRWVWNQPIVPTRGIDVMEAVYTKTGWRIKTDYAEFNNVALLANFGFCPAEGACPATPPPKMMAMR